MISLRYTSTFKKLLAVLVRWRQIGLTRSKQSRQTVCVRSGERESGEGVRERERERVEYHSLARPWLALAGCRTEQETVNIIDLV